MGRKKLQVEYIKKDKLRSTTFQNRKRCILKKASELAILCDVPVCIIMYQSPNSDPNTFVFNHDEVRSIIDRYADASFSREEPVKLTANMVDSTKTRKPSSSTTTTNTPCLFRLSKEELVTLASHLDSKLHVLRERIGKLRGSSGNYCAEDVVFGGGSSGAVVPQPPQAMYDGSLEFTL